MTATIVVLSVILIFSVFLLIPFTAKIYIGDQNDITVKYLFFKLYPKSEKKSKTERKHIVNGEKKENENFFIRSFKKKGFLEFVSLFFGFLKKIIEELAHLLKYVKIRKFTLSLTVASDNAAKTAIEYGAVSAAVYNFSALIKTNFDFEIKNISIDCDFEKDAPHFELFTVLKISPLVLIISAVKLIKPVLNFVKEVS